MCGPSSHPAATTPTSYTATSASMQTHIPAKTVWWSTQGLPRNCHQHQPYHCSGGGDRPVGGGDVQGEHGLSGGRLPSHHGTGGLHKVLPCCFPDFRFPHNWLYWGINDTGQFFRVFPFKRIDHALIPPVPHSQQAQLFEKTVGSPVKIIVFEMNDELMRVRLEGRGNFDDRKDAIRFLRIFACSKL